MIITADRSVLPELAAIAWPGWLRTAREADLDELTRKQIGQRTTPKATGTAVGNALALNAKMISIGLSSPWHVVYEPPSDMPKLRRHKNANYQFVPLKGDQRPSCKSESAT